MLTAKNGKYFHKKAAPEIFDKLFNASLGLHFLPLLILGITLSLEFYILAKIMFTGVKRHIKDIIKRLRYSLFTKCEETLMKLVTNFSKNSSDLLENLQTDYFEGA